MLNLCQLKEDLTNPKNTYSATVWDRLNSAFHIASQLIKWIGIKSGTLGHCNHGAQVYYLSVDKFAHSNFGSGDQTHCLLACTHLLGNPQNLI